jgi:hypothetical protein
MITVFDPSHWSSAVRMAVTCHDSTRDPGRSKVPSCRFWGKAGSYGPAVGQAEKVEPTTAYDTAAVCLERRVCVPKGAMLAGGNDDPASCEGKRVTLASGRLRSATCFTKTERRHGGNYEAQQCKTPRTTSLPNTRTKKDVHPPAASIGNSAEAPTEPVLSEGKIAPDFREPSDWPTSIGERWLASRSRTCALSSSSLAPSSLPFSSFTLASFPSLPVQLAIKHTRHANLHLYDSTTTPPPPNPNTHTHLSKWVSRTVRFSDRRGRHRANLLRHSLPTPIEHAHGDDTCRGDASYDSQTQCRCSSSLGGDLRKVVTLRQRAARRRIARLQMHTSLNASG